MDHPGLQVQQHSPRDVMFIICLSKGSQDGPNELGWSSPLSPQLWLLEALPQDSHSVPICPEFPSTRPLPVPSGPQGRGQVTGGLGRRGHLIEKDVLAVSALGGELLYDALGADAMLSTQLFPELEPN